MMMMIIIIIIITIISSSRTGRTPRRGLHLKVSPLAHTNTKTKPTTNNNTY